jgi:hypothetical protein
MSYKKRQYRLKKRAAKILAQVGYDVIFPRNEILFDLVAIYKDRVRYIVICLDKPNKELIGRIKAAKKPGEKEIWYRKEDNKIETIYL